MKYLILFNMISLIGLGHIINVFNITNNYFIKENEKFDFVNDIFNPQFDEEFNFERVNNYKMNKLKF